MNQYRWSPLVALLALGVMGTALGPQEHLQDPSLDDRARALYAEVRCVVCQNESLADSTADIAADMRRDIRRSITAGKSDVQIRTELSQRYGDYVLFRPRFELKNSLLWFAPLLILLMGVLAFWRLTHRPLRAGASEGAPQGLSDEETARLNRLLDQDKDIGA